MKRYEPSQWDFAEMVQDEKGEWLSLAEMIEFIRVNEPSLLTDFYAAIDVKRVQR